jgi:hypothetical protein
MAALITASQAAEGPPLLQLLSVPKSLLVAPVQLVVPLAHGAAEADVGENVASAPARTASTATRIAIDLRINGFPLDCSQQQGPWGNEALTTADATVSGRERCRQRRWAARSDFPSGVQLPARFAGFMAITVYR